MDVLRSARKLIEGMATGETTLSRQRQAVCERCDDLVRHPIKRCGVCGCLIKGKTQHLDESCPVGKW